ncbi:MAG: TIGR04283 family arsenosugar biosynthesis glycosyltransferase [Thermodesulfobacteriota bacterium]
MTSTKPKTSNISIIVPTLDEADNLAALHSIASMANELIIADGGSEDETVRLAKEYSFQVVVSHGGRGAQLNAGAAAAASPLLLFLHADTRLPADFPEAVTACLENPATILGAFSLQVETGRPLIRLICRAANIRSKILQLPYGDQALFLRKDTFNKLGGFPEIPIMEDYALVKSAQKAGQVVTLSQAVTTSTRRWQKLGPIRTTLVNQLMLAGYHLGISPVKLALFYRSRTRSIFRKLGGDKGTDTVG